MYTYIRTYIHACITYIHTYIHTLRTYIHIHTYMHTYIHYMHTCITYMHYIHACIHYVRTYVHTWQAQTSPKRGARAIKNNTLETHTGDNSARSVWSAPTKSGRGVHARIRHYCAMIDSNNSAHFCLGFITKVDRGVVRGLREIKILHRGIPKPQTELRAHTWKHQAKMRGVNSALSRSRCKGGGGCVLCNTHIHELWNTTYKTHTTYIQSRQAYTFNIQHA